MKFLKIALFFIFSVCRADQYVSDLADKPGLNYGTLTLEAGVCAGVSGLGRMALDDAGQKGLDFIPAVMLTAAGFLIHSQYWSEGGQNARNAWIEQGFESAGSFSILLF
jgi:hypothetical protein